MAERKLNVSLIIGGKIAPTLKGALRKTERAGIRAGKRIQDGLHRAKVGEQLAKDVLKYRSSLDQLKAKQAQLGTSNAKLNREIADVNRRFFEAKRAAKAYGLSIANIREEHDQLAAAARRSERALGRAQALQRNRETRSQVQSEMFTAAAPALLLAKPIGEAIEFESVMANVNKVVGLESPKALNQMRHAILNMATDKRIPLLPSQIGEIVTAFAREGTPKNLLLPLAEDAAKVAVAFDITGEKAAQGLNRLRRTFSATRQELLLIADGINVLDNKTGATAAGILNFSNRAAAQGKAAGLSANEINALGAAFITLGSDPEIAARAVNSVLTKLSNAERQTPKFKKSLRELGLEATRLSDHFKRDARGALLAFLHAANETEGASGILFDLLGEGFSDDFMKLAQGVSEFEKALGLLKDSARVAGAVQDEYNTRAATTANDLVILKNQAIRLGVTIGSQLLPPLKTAVGVLGGVGDGVARAAEQFPTLTKVIGLATMAVVGLKIATLGAKVAGTLFSDAWIMGKGALDALSPSALKATRDLWKMRAATALNNATLIKTRAASVLSVSGLKSLALKAIPLVITAWKGMSLAMLANPLGLMIAGIAAGALLIVKFWKPIKAFMGGVMQGIKDALGPETMGFISELGTVVGWLGSLFKGLISPAMSSKAELDGFAGVGRDLGKVIGLLFTPLKLLIRTITWTSEKIANLLDKLDLFNKGKKLMGTMASGIKEGGKSVLARLKGVFSKVDDHMPKSDAKIGPLSTLTASGVALVKTVGEGVTKGAASLTGPLGQVLEQAKPKPPALSDLGASAGANLAGFLAGVSPGSAPPAFAQAGTTQYHVDFRGMTIHAGTAKDGEQVATALEATVRRVLDDLDRQRAARRRGALHDGDSEQVGAL